MANAKNEIILEMANRIAKRRENWDLGVLVEHIWDNCDLEMFKVIWGNLLLLRLFHTNFTSPFLQHLI